MRRTDDKFEFTQEAHTLVNILADHLESMEPYEREFIEGLAERFEKFGDETFVSEKQIKWLRSLERNYAN